jgi:hypothetical protein
LIPAALEVFPRLVLPAPGVRPERPGGMPLTLALPLPDRIAPGLVLLIPC